MAQATAFVLAAGFGTRLRPLTETVPKPLVPVCGVPLLAYTLALCAHHGLDQVIVNAHWLHEKLLPWSGTHEGCTVQVVYEPKILGTGGGLRNVSTRLAPRFAVLNSDILHNVNLHALLGAVVEGGGAMALRPDPEHAPRYGVVAADQTHTVVKMVEFAHAAPVGAVDATTHFTGIHAMSHQALERVPDGFACIVRTAYRSLVPERKVGAIRYEGRWLDAGTPADYLAANLEVLHSPQGLALDPHIRASFARDGSGHDHGTPPCQTKGPVWVGHDTQTEGATLEHAVVGHGARLSPGAHLRRCVVWDGVAVPAGDHQDMLFIGGEPLRVAGQRA
jgi:mannose-1-phosphate guanylyltransferase